MSEAPTAYALRVDEGPDVSGWLSRYAATFIAARESHEGENPHIHVLFRSTQSMSALRKACQRSFPGGNGSYSLKKCTDDVAGYERYICKGDSESTLPEIICKQGIEYTEDWVKDQHAAYWVNNAAIHANRQARKRIKSATAVEKLEEICKNLGVKWNDRVRIGEEYLKLLVGARKAINIFQVRAVINCVSCALCPDGQAINLLAEVSSNL